MKLTITPDGTVTVETIDTPTAAEFLRQLFAAQVRETNGQRALNTPASSSQSAKPPVKRRKPAAPVHVDRPLAPTLDATWAWMAAHDTPDGLTRGDISDGMGITASTAVYRLKELVARDMAWKISRGRYRVGSMVDGQVVA